MLGSGLLPEEEWLWSSTACVSSTDMLRLPQVADALPPLLGSRTAGAVLSTHRSLFRCSVCRETILWSLTHPHGQTAAIVPSSCSSLQACW